MVNQIQNKIFKDVKKNIILYLFVLPAIIQFILFSYLPMFGIIIAFENFNPAKGYFRSEWVWFENFIRFFSSPISFRVITNSVILSLLNLLWTLPFPIIFAIMLNELRNKYLKRIVQTVSILPYFLSNVIIISIVYMLLSLDTGAVNVFISKILGMDQIYFLIESKWFRPIYVLTSIWQTTGWSAIIYLASISGINPQLYESAIIDGASRLKKIYYITIPLLKPTIVILLIFGFASVMSVGFEKVYLLATPPTFDVSEVIETFTYKRGLGIGTGIPDYSYGGAVGMFQSTLNAMLLVGANWFSGRFFGRRIY